MFSVIFPLQVAAVTCLALRSENILWVQWSEAWLLGVLPFDGLWIESRLLFKVIYASEVGRSSVVTAVNRHELPLSEAPFGALACPSFSLHIW